jgi:hypothetical protein
VITKPIPFIEVVEDARIKGIHPASGSRALPQRNANGDVRIYCVSCSHPGAFVSEDSLQFVIYLCDQFSPCGCDCMTTKGELSLPRLAI